MRIGTLLRGLRLAHFAGDTVRTFAHTVGIPERTVGAIEAGWRFPSPSTLTLYFQMEDPRGQQFKQAASLASRTYREELVLRRLILDEPWFTSAHVLARQVLRTLFETLTDRDELTAVLLEILGHDSSQDSCLAGRPEACLVTALKILTAEPAGVSEGVRTIPTGSSGRARAFYTFFLRYLLSEIKFFAEADIKYEQMDSPFSEKQINTIRARDVADLLRILDSGMVPNAFSVVDLLILGGWARVDFDLAVPGSISVVVPFDGSDPAKPNEVCYTTRVVAPEGQVIQPYVRTPWRPSQTKFTVEVVSGSQDNRQ